MAVVIEEEGRCKFLEMLGKKHEQRGERLTPSIKQS